MGKKTRTKKNRGQGSSQKMRDTALPPPPATNIHSGHGRSLPEDIVSKILIELPAKSLMRFRCVSKTWLSIVNDPYFVNSHHDRSHTRPGGTTLIVWREVHEDPWGWREPIYKVFSTDPQGKSPLKHLTLPAAVPPKYYFLDNLPSVRGLVCVGNCIWNPTINESVVLPSFSLPSINADCEKIRINDNVVGCEIRHCEEYALGFDSSNNAYKVLGGFHSFRSRRFKSGRVFLDKRQTQLKILDLGGSTWRDIESLPSDEEFLQSIYHGIRNSCCIDNLLFVRLRSAFAAFDFESEMFEVIPVPDGLTYKNDMPMIQVGECIALINEEIDKIWILEDYYEDQWKSESLVIEPLKEVIKFKSKIEDIRITPVGAFHTSNEILLHVRADKKQYFYYYNINTKTYRIVRKLTRKIRGIRDPELKHIANDYALYHIYLKKHVESVYQLV